MINRKITILGPEGTNLYILLQFMMLGISFEGTLEFVDEIDRELKIEGNFVFFLASNLSHTSWSSITSPMSKPDDGYIYLSYALQPCSSFKLLNILLGLEDGSYIKNVKYVKTTWFNIVPYSNDKDLFYDIDGERFDIEPVEVSINPKSLKVIV